MKKYLKLEIQPFRINGQRRGGWETKINQTQDWNSSKSNLIRNENEILRFPSECIQLKIVKDIEEKNENNQEHKTKSDKNNQVEYKAKKI